MRRRSIAVIVGATALTLAVGTWIVTDALNLIPSTATYPLRAKIQEQPEIVAQSGPPSISIRQGENTPVSAPEVASLWEPVQQAADEGSWVTWGAVIDADSGEILLDQSASNGHTPASTTKILAAFTALSHLNTSDRLTTGVKMEGTNLYLWGQGDLLLTEDHGRKDSINGYAGIADLASQSAQSLTEQGVTSVTVNWQGNPFSGDAHLKAWATQEVANYEGAVGAMAINAGSLSDDEYIFTATPEEDVARSFVTALENQGIGAQLGQETTAPEEATDIATVHSATIGQQLRYMLHHSDNTLADQYCRLAAQAQGVDTSYTGAVNLVKSTLGTQGVSTAGLSLQDCSGLSSDDKISANTLVQALRVAFESAQRNGSSTGGGDENAQNTASGYLSDLVRDLPWAGLQGTMSRRMVEDVSAGNVQAKTGSLGSVSSLAGIVTTTGGRTLIFAVGNDGVPDGAAALTRPYLDTFVEGLAAL